MLPAKAMRSYEAPRAVLREAADSFQGAGANARLVCAVEASTNRRPSWAGPAERNIRATKWGGDTVTVGYCVRQRC